MTEVFGWTTEGQQLITPARQRWNAERFEREYKKAVKSRRHMYIATLGFLVFPPLHSGTMLDADSLIGQPVIGCFICEDGWSPGHENTRCPGEPAAG